MSDSTTNILFSLGKYDLSIETALLILLILTLWFRSWSRRGQLASLATAIKQQAIKMALTPEAIKRIADAALKEEDEAAKEALRLATERAQEAAKKLADSSASHWRNPRGR